MIRVTKVLILLLIVFNFTFAQDDLISLRQQINSKIGKIRELFSQMSELVKRFGDNPIIRECLFRGGDCYDDFNELIGESGQGGRLGEAIKNLNNQSTSSLLSNLKDLKDLWNKIYRIEGVSSFPILFRERQEKRFPYTYIISMGVNESEWFRWYRDRIARDVVIIHVLNNNDGDRGTNYRNFFNEALNITNGLTTTENYIYLFKRIEGNEDNEHNNELRKSFEYYLSYLKNEQVLEKMRDFTIEFRNVINNYDNYLKDITYICATTLKEIENKIDKITNIDTLRNISNNLDKFITDIETSGRYFGNANYTLPRLFSLIYQQGFLRTFSKASGFNESNNYGFQHIFPNQLDNEIEFWRDFKSSSVTFFQTFTMYCVGETLEKGKTPAGKSIDEVSQNFNRAAEAFGNKFSIVSVSLEIESKEVSIAVIPPIVWTDKHEGVESLKQITPERIFDEVRSFLFSLAPIIFIILLIIGGIFYIASPIKIEYIKSGSEYIKWAIIGYFLLLAISAIFSALKFILGSP